MQQCTSGHGARAWNDQQRGSGG